MSDLQIAIPSKPRIVSEEKFTGIYEIDGLYPGYGHTLGNSLRRIILSSLPGSAITNIKIEGVNHEFSTIKGVKEDVINIILNLRKVRIKMLTEEEQQLTLKIKGPKVVTAKDIDAPGQVEILNKDQVLFEITDTTEVIIDINVEHGLGFLAKDQVHKDRLDAGSISLDSNFTPIRRVNYEVENMRVGDRTDFNRLRVFIETDGTITPKEALERSVEIMINQLKAIIGFKEEVEVDEVEEVIEEVDEKEIEDFLKTRVEKLDISPRTITALSNANIRTVGGLARKREDDLGEIEGLGGKGVDEIKDLLKNNGITLK
jgi:DNA-directed RNA polymerase subunit alpha